jgi:hypothetical protein
MMIDFVRHFLIIAIISLTLLAIVLSFFSQFVLPAMRLKKDLQATIERVRRLKAGSKGRITDLEEISQEILTSERFSHPWQEYRETLHEQQCADPEGKGKSVRWRSTTLAETFFSEQALVDTPLKTSFYKHLPGILTGLGIIGTFSGLIVGLIRFEVSGDADKVRASLNGLIQSVGYSFVVSATAITLAMIFIWVEKSLVTACYRKVESLCQLIDSLFDTGAGEEYLARLVVAAETSAEHSLTIKDSLVTDLRQVFTELFTQQMKASALLNKNLSATIAQGITKSIEEPMGRISMAVEKASTNQGEAVNKVLTDALAGFSSQMQGMFGNQFHEMGDILKSTAEAIQGAALQVSRCVETMQATGKDTELAMAQRLNSAVNSLDERQKIMDRSMSVFVEKTSEVNTSQTDATRNMQSILTDMGERMAGIVNQIETQSRHTAQEYEARQDRLAEQSVSIMGEITSQLRTLAGEMRLAGEVTRDSAANLSHITKESTELFNAGAHALQVSFKDFSKASGMVSTTMQAIEKASATIQGASSNLAQATSGVKDMMEEHRRTSDIFATIVSELRSTIENARHEASMTTQIVSRIQMATEQLGIAQNKAEEYLHGLTDVLAQAHAEFAGNIELTLRKSNTQFHEELSRAVSLVSGAIQDFGDVLDSASDKGDKQCWV